MVSLGKGNGWPWKKWLALEKAMDSLGKGNGWPWKRQWLALEKALCKVHVAYLEKGFLNTTKWFDLQNCR